jgi:hemerythrin
MEDQQVNSGIRVNRKNYPKCDTLPVGMFRQSANSHGEGMFVHWEPAYEIGNTLMDAEHRMLMMLCRKLDYAIKTDASDVTTHGIIREMKSFTRFHFLSEETLMHEVGYPGWQEHADQHADLLIKLDAIAEKVSIGGKSAKDALSFMHSWLLGHIQTADKNLGAFTETSGSRPIAETFYNHFLRPQF